MALREQRLLRNTGNFEENASSVIYNEAANEANLVLTNFVCEEFRRDGIENAPDFEQLHGSIELRGPSMELVRETRRGSMEQVTQVSMESVREIGRALRYFGDSSMADGLQALVDRVEPEAEERTITNVARRIFDDGVFNWGRVAALFHFAYKVCVKAIGRIDIIRNIINTIVEFMRTSIIQWIVENGGWEAILQLVKHRRRTIAFLALGSLTVYGQNELSFPKPADFPQFQRCLFVMSGALISTPAETKSKESRPRQ